jgi:hypothetical protein
MLTRDKLPNDTPSRKPGHAGSLIRLAVWAAVAQAASHLAPVLACPREEKAHKIGLAQRRDDEVHHPPFSAS